MKIFKNSTLFFRLQAGDPFYLNGTLCMKVDNPDATEANHFCNIVQVYDGKMRYVDYNAYVEPAFVHVDEDEH